MIGHQFAHLQQKNLDEKNPLTEVVVFKLFLKSYLSGLQINSDPKRSTITRC